VNIPNELSVKKNKIVCVHLFNNFSGSPKVLRQVIVSLLLKGYEIDLITNKTEGFLSNIDGVNYVYINYNWSNNKVVTLLNFLIAQVELFFKVIRYKDDDSILYINTITPIGAALAGKLTKKKIIYHVHEKYVKSNIVNRICQYVFEQTVSKTIYVSNYLKCCYDSPELTDSAVIYNSLDSDFKQVAAEWLNKDVVRHSDTILMLCSLRAFKGIYEFVKLSNLLTQYKFVLVLSASEAEVEAFSKEINCGSNLRIYPNQIDLHPFFKEARVLLNLSNPDFWIETFGLTILEAMEYGIPAIVPFLGGPTELIFDGYNGFQVDPRDIYFVKNKIELLMSDNELYHSFSENSLQQKGTFDNCLLMDEIENYLVY
jgi:L-malate glycosyltransferase